MSLSKNVTVSKNNLLLRWDITKGCNLSCKHCISSHMYDGISELTKDEKILLIQKVAKEGITRMHLLGGDPLTIPYIGDIIKECSKNNIYVSLNTNGHRLDHDVALCELFAEHAVGISFSVDGGNKASHDKMRGTGSYDVVMKAAENYGEIIKKYQNPITSAFYVTLTPDNMNDDYGDLFKLAEQYNINNIVLGVLIPKGAGSLNYNINDLSVSQIISKTEEFVVLGEEYSSIKVSFPFQTPLLLNYLNAKLGTNFGLYYAKCKSGVTDFQLQVDGSIFPCIYINKPIDCSDNYNKKQFRGSNNLLNNTVNEITNNDFFKSFYQCLENMENISHVSPCNECPYCNVLDICRPCAFQHIKNDKDTPDFHKNIICQEILRKNENNYYYPIKKGDENGI